MMSLLIIARYTIVFDFNTVNPHPTLDLMNQFYLRLQIVIKVSRGYEAICRSTFLLSFKPSPLYLKALSCLGIFADIADTKQRLSLQSGYLNCEEDDNP